MSNAPRHRHDAPGPGDRVEVEFVDAPNPDTREMLVIPASGLPVRLERDGVEYGLTGGHVGEPVHYDYHRLDDEAPEG